MVVFYDLKHHSFETTLVEPITAPAVDDAADPVICRCLQVRESTIVRAVENGGARSLCQIACATGAGGGCTACHRKLRQYFAKKPHPANEAVVPALAPALQEALDKGELREKESFCGETACGGEGCSVSKLGGALSGLLLPHPSAIADSSPDRPR